MTGAAAETLALLLLAVVLATAIARPFGIPEVAVAVPSAAVLVVTGVERWSDVRHAVNQLGSTVAFLIVILVFGQLCAGFGVFDYLGAQAQRAARGRATRLLGLVVALAAAVTAVLTLDATVVLLTPVVLATTARMRVRSRPHAFACLHLANSGSLLLPVSNLTNLLAYAASGLSFVRFTSYMALPWVVACGLEYVALRVAFRGDLGADAAVVRADTNDDTNVGDTNDDHTNDDDTNDDDTNDDHTNDDDTNHINDTDDDAPAAPRYALVVLGATVVGFVAVTAAGWSPAWAALGGAIALGAPALRTRRISPVSLVKAANFGFAAFVFALGVLVDGVTRHGLGHALHDITPHGHGLVSLLVVAVLAAGLSNVVNNLPATLALIPVVTGQPALVLAMLIGVNVGPNLTYPGSLANLLWNRLLPERDRPGIGIFHLFGLASVPVVLVGSTVALWAGLAL